MGEKLIIGPINRGLKTDRLPFVIDNDSFPKLVNAYQWRGRVKRKRGTSFVCRLSRQQSISGTLSGGTFTVSTVPIAIGSIKITDSTTGYLYTDSYDKNGILRITTTITGASKDPECVLLANNNFLSGDSVFINSIEGMVELNGNTYTIISADPTTITLNVDSSFFTDYISGGIVQDRTLIGGTINYNSGVVTIVGGGSNAITGSYSYYPALPVMGLRDFNDPSFPYAQTLGFDTKYSYSISTSAPYGATDVSFYKNPVADATALPGYVPKTNQTPLTWNGKDYQQFWTVNYQGSLWATNGVDVVFTGDTIGMQFAGGNSGSTITYVSSTIGTPPTIPSTITLTITSCPLVEGDFVFFNEWGPAPVPPSSTSIADYLNFQTGYVTSASPNTPAPATKTITISLPNATLQAGTYTPGIVQYLTTRSNPDKDCIRWYDGNNPGQGWVNFMPPLSQGTYTIEDAPPAQYYLVGAKTIVPFKDRLLFFGAVIQSSTGIPIYLQDTVVFSLNGTPYYTTSFTPVLGNILNTQTNFFPILVPIHQTAVPFAYWEDQFGFGGFRAAGVYQAITTVSPNEDALIVGFNNSLQTRFIFSGNDLQPFDFYTINAELGSGSTFSSITMDDGVITRGPRGFIMTSQTSCQRIDLDILDQIFEVSELDNGAERFCAQRDFVNEWIYFTYSHGQSYIYPTQTLLYNYRDNSWAIFNESYTTYGAFRPIDGFTWATIGEFYPTWNSWNEPWEAGVSQPLSPQVIGGNAQGFVIMRDKGTSEATSLYIKSITGSTITSPNHCLNKNDYIYISGSLGITGINNKTFKVVNCTENTFDIIPPPTTSGTYNGGGLIKRMYVPFIQSKQFPISWGIGRKVRLGPQQYLFTGTNISQITLQIFLSQDNTTPYNDPDFETNDSIIFSTTLYTCPESTNLGLTPFNTNLQMIANPGSTSGVGGNSTQQQIWHRINTSLIGDTIQFAFTMNDAQMLSMDSNNYPVNAFEEIEFHAAILDVSPSGLLS